MIDVRKLLYEVCEDDAVFEEGIDLIDSGLLDSLALINLFAALEDEGIEIWPTRIDRNCLRTPEGIGHLIAEYEKSHGQ